MELVGHLDHVNIDTSRPDETIAFYVDVLGLENRPEIAFRQVFLSDPNGVGVEINIPGG